MPVLDAGFACSGALANLAVGKFVYRPKLAKVPGPGLELSLLNVSEWPPEIRRTFGWLYRFSLSGGLTLDSLVFTVLQDAQSSPVFMPITEGGKR
jgi:hypothetical protein